MPKNEARRKNALCLKIEVLEDRLAPAIDAVVNTSVGAAFFVQAFENAEGIHRGPLANGVIEFGDYDAHSLVTPYTVSGTDYRTSTYSENNVQSIARQEYNTTTVVSRAGNVISSAMSISFNASATGYSAIISFMQLRTFISLSGIEPDQHININYHSTESYGEIYVDPQSGSAAIRASNESNTYYFDTASGSGNVDLVVSDDLTIDVALTLYGRYWLIPAFTDTEVFSINMEIELIEDKDILVESLHWNTDNGSIDYFYTITGNELEAPTTVSAYWATGPSLADRLPNTPPITTIATGTAVGNYGPFNISRSTLGTPPAGATHIIVVADPPTDALPNGLVDPENEGNNVLSLELPDLKPLYLEWNNARKPNDPLESYVKYGYEILNTDLPKNTEVAFFWSETKEYNPETATALSASELVDILESKYGDTAPYYADVSTWSAAPSDARYLLAVTDPNDLILERDEENNVKWLPVASVAELMSGSVTPGPAGGATITAEFRPGVNAPDGLVHTLAEAAVVLGVDHFNWRQQVIDLPANWAPFTLANMDYSKIGDNASNIGLAFDGTDIHFRYVDSDTPISTTPVSKPFYDPLVSDTGTSISKYTRAFIIGTKSGDPGIVLWRNGDFTIDGISYSGPIPDDKRFFYNESESTDWRWIGSQFENGGTVLAFADKPLNPLKAFDFGGALSFETRLVGVPYDQADPSSYLMWGSDQGVGIGWKTNFTWNSNAAQNSHNVVSWGAGETDRPQVIAGGIFNVRFDDGTLIPGFAVTAPPLTTQPTIQKVLYANNQTQRSKFVTAQVYFDSLVTIQKNAFQLYLNNKPFTVSSFFTTVVDGKTVATLQFPYKLLPNASLPEGSYRLVTRAAAVKNLQNQKMTGDFTDSFFRLYGDVNGDGNVDGTDQSVFNTAYGKKVNQAGYLWFLDYDGNGKIDAKDKAAFNARVGRHV